MDLDGFVSAIVPIFLISGWIIFDKTRNLYQCQNLFQKVGWIAEKEYRTVCYSDSVRLRNMELISYIAEEQQSLSINENLRIDFSNEAERKNIEEILNLHKADVIKSYFHGFLSKSKNICKLNAKEYYFYSLYCFIYKELKEYKYQDEIYKDKEYTDKTHFNCKLTDYGRAYYKLYLITQMFVENNERTKKLFEYINPKLRNQIADYLNKNEVGFWSYRP